MSTGREILNKSIELIEAGNYGAKVVYGDTDSLFVYFLVNLKLKRSSLVNKLPKRLLIISPIL